MKLLLLTVGKPALPYARAGRDEYLGRIAKFGTVEHITVKASDPARESKALLDLSHGCLRIALDERGVRLTSRELAAELDRWRHQAKTVSLIIGGAAGHDPSLTTSADRLLSLGPLTLQHELALVVLLEQIYRAHTILSGHPYHRD